MPRDETSMRRSKLSSAKRALLESWMRNGLRAPAGAQVIPPRSERAPAILNTTQSLFQQAMTKLANDPVTRTIPSKLQDPQYDQSFAAWLCNIMQKICNKRDYPFDQAVQDFVDLSYDFLSLQIELVETGRYACKSFEEARQTVYDNPDVMEGKYLNGLLLSQAFWINHFKMLSYFKRHFCVNAINAGDVLEVAVGTGIYIAEFMKANPNWNGIAIDLSPSSVGFARDLLELVSPNKVVVERKNVFDMPTEKKYAKVICGELLEHLEYPEDLLRRVQSLLQEDGKLFLTTAIWAASIDHIYLFESAQDVRDMLNKYFAIESELVLNVFDAKAEDEKTPINYGCILGLKGNQ